MVPIEVQQVCSNNTAFYSNPRPNPNPNPLPLPLPLTQVCSNTTFYSSVLEP